MWNKFILCKLNLISLCHSDDANICFFFILFITMTTPKGAYSHFCLNVTETEEKGQRYTTNIVMRIPSGFVSTMFLLSGRKGPV